MPRLDVYSRRGCHLCEVLVEQLLEAARGRAEVVVHDVDSRDDWRAAYDVRVPVVECQGELVCEHRFDRDAVERALSGLAQSG